MADLLLNLPEYIFAEDPRPTQLNSYTSARGYREQYAWQTEPRYEIACDFANAWKHRRITRQGRKLNGIEDASESFAICRYRDSQGFYARGHKIVVLKLVDNTLIDLRRVLVSSAAFWANELFRIGLIPSAPDGIASFGEFTSRTDPNALKPLRLQALSGEDWKCKGESLDFVPVTQCWIDPLPNWGRFKIPMHIDVRKSPFEPQE